MSTDASGAEGATLLATRIARALPRLRPSEVRVVKTMLELGTALETMTSSQVAAKAAVRASTVVRTCHLLGFQSFGEARAAVRQWPGG